MDEIEDLKIEFIALKGGVEKTITNLEDKLNSSSAAIESFSMRDGDRTLLAEGVYS